MRNSLCLAVAAGLLSAAPLVQASTTVTTNDYDAESVETDPDKSCKDLDLDSTGKLTGKCNVSNSGGGVTTQDTSLALESYAECQGGTLQWGSGGFIANLSGADIRLSSDGKKYLLNGTCTSDTGFTDTVVDDLPLDEKVGNAGGSFIYIPY